VIASALTLAVVAVPPAAHATTGTLTISRNTTLTENHVGNVVIAASNVTLDCRNYTIHGLAGAGIGISMNYVRGVTIKNCTITGGFGFGIYTVSDSNNRLMSNWISVSGLACRLNGSTQNLVQSNVLQGNGYGGCMIIASNSNTFAYNKVNYNGNNGLWLISSNGNNVVGNETGANGIDGIQVTTSQSNTLDSNTANLNNRDGIRLDRSSNHNVVNNSACSNKGLDANMIGDARNRFAGNRFCRKSPNIP
jgi:parallel beta-helix repeat protein